MEAEGLISTPHCSWWLEVGMCLAASDSVRLISQLYYASTVRRFKSLDTDMSCLEPYQ